MRHNVGAKANFYTNCTPDSDGSFFGESLENYLGETVIDIVDVPSDFFWIVYTDNVGNHFKIIALNNGFKPLM